MSSNLKGFLLREYLINNLNIIIFENTFLVLDKISTLFADDLQ